MRARPIAQLTPALTPPCTASLLDLTTVELPDGRGLYVEPEAIASRDGRVLILGNPVLITTNGVVAPARIDGRPAVGALLDSGGIGMLVAAPTTDSVLVNPHVISSADGRFTVLWIRVSHTEMRSHAAGTLMESTFDGETWTPPVAITQFDRVFLNPQSSELITTPSGIAIAMPTWQEGDKGEVALLVKEGSSWRRVDIPLVDAAVGATLSIVGARWVVAYVGRYADREGVFTVRSFDGGRTWSQPIHLLESAWSLRLVTPLAGLALLALGDTGTPPSPRLRMVRSTDVGATRWSAPVTVPDGDSASGFAVLPLSPHVSVVLEQKGQFYRRTHTIGVLNDRAIQWLRTDTVDAIRAPLLARGRARDVFALWAAADMAGGTPMPRLSIARYRIACMER